ncbi:DEAD-box ATP-dependent RNA helicase 57, partial [Monoraphidium neglectum]
MDPFALLTSGAKFDRGRMKQDQNVYRGQQHRAAAHALPPGLLKAPAAAAGGQPPRKKRRLQHATAHAGASESGADDHQGSDPGISVFGGSQSPAGGAGGQRRRDDAVAAAGMAGAGAGAEALPEVRTHDPNEEANSIRKALRIKVSGGGAPCPLRGWEELGERYHVGPRLRAALAGAGWADPTPIQRQAVPALLEGRELLAIAPTGSGKTLAFLLPVVAALRRARNEGGAAWPDAPKALFLSPTHELAGQTARVLRKLLPGTKLRACLLSKATAAGSDFAKVDILVANPLRLRTLVEDGKMDLSHLSHLVIDEADKLFEMGFTEQASPQLSEFYHFLSALSQPGATCRTTIHACTTRQVDALLAAATRPDITRALFSATLPEKVEDLARTVLRDPLRVTVGERNTAAAMVAQRLQFVGREGGKLMTLRQMLAGGLTPPVLVFVSTKERAKLLHRELMYDGVRADHISADQSQAARTAAVENFRAGRTWVLIATDLIGRGMDFVGVNTVVNYDFPKTAADYIHRVGRTGRAGRA